MTTPKQIIFENEARDLLLAGIKKLADVVAFIEKKGLLTA